MSEFSDLFSEWMENPAGDPVSVSVKTKTGGGGLGPTFEEPASVTDVLLLYGNALIRDSTGNEQTTSATLFVELGADADRFTLGSLVTMPDGRERTVLTVSSPDVAGVFSFRTVALT